MPDPDDVSQHLDGEDLGALTFEQLLARLEAVTAQLADGELGIEAAADLYERARVLHAAAGDRLDRVSQRIATLEAPTDGVSDARRG